MHSLEETGKIFKPVTCLLGLVSFAILSILLQENSIAAPPVNDMFANATVISGNSGSQTGTNVDATAEAGEPDHGGSSNPLHSVWYKWTAPSNSTFIFNTNGSTFDTVLAVYTGDPVNNLTLIDTDNNSGVGYNSQIVLNASGGVVYSFAVDSSYIETGQVSFNWGLANFITGSVSLPASQVAPAGGISATVSLIDNNWESVGSTPVVIPAGSSSVTYSLTGVLDSQRNLTVYYSYPGSNYLAKGYYNSSGTQWSPDRATYFTGGTSRSGINLTLLSGNSVSGTLILPNPLIAPPGGTLCNVYVLDEDFSQQQSETITIAAGQSSAFYTIPIPNSSLARRAIQGHCTHTEIFETAYYNSSGSEWDENGAQFLSGGNDYTSRNMIFYPAATITGTLSLPGGDVAPPENFDTSIFAYSEGAKWPIQQLGGILSGGSTWAYSITVPSDPAANWRISYWGAFPENLNYLFQGFHTSSGTHWNPANAQLLTGGTDHSNIDLTVISKASLDTIYIYGILYIQNGLPAPYTTGAVIQILNPEYPDNRYEVTAGIEQGEYSGDYSLELPQSSSINWVARYLGAGNTHEKAGYYRGSKTVCSINNAFKLNGENDHGGINLTLLKKCEGLTCFPANAQGNKKSMICF